MNNAFNVLTSRTSTSGVVLHVTVRLEDEPLRACAGDSQDEEDDEVGYE